MKKIIKQIKLGAKHTRLNVSEKAEMKYALLQYVQANPARVATSIPSPFSIDNIRGKKSISVLVIGGLLLGSTVSFAAENAIPGDVLFPVKVHVNENVRGTFAITPKAKAEWEVRLVERRLEEVEKIAIAPGVSPEVHKIAEENLERYSERVKHRIKELEEDDDSEDALLVVSSFSDVLNDHERVIVELNINKVDTETNTFVVTLATTTPVSTVVFTKEEKSQNTLERVRTTRDEAKKKQKELEDRRDRNRTENERKNEERETLNTSIQPKEVKDRSENRIRREEFRSNDRKENQSNGGELKRLEDKKRSDDRNRESEDGRKNNESERD